MQNDRNPAWLYHDDIGGVDAKPVTLTVRGVEEVECGGKTHVGVRFRFRRQATASQHLRRYLSSVVVHKLLVLNETNVKSVQAMLGSDTDTWTGRKVVLYVLPDTGRGYGPGIRIRGVE